MAKNRNRDIQNYNDYHAFRNNTTYNNDYSDNHFANKAIIDSEINNIQNQYKKDLLAQQEQEKLDKEKKKKEQEQLELKKKEEAKIAIQEAIVKQNNEKIAAENLAKKIEQEEKQKVIDNLSDIDKEAISNIEEEEKQKGITSSNSVDFYIETKSLRNKLHDKTIIGKSENVKKTMNNTMMFQQNEKDGVIKKYSKALGNFGIDLLTTVAQINYQIDQKLFRPKTITKQEEETLKKTEEELFKYTSPVIAKRKEYITNKNNDLSKKEELLYQKLKEEKKLKGAYNKNTLNELDHIQTAIAMNEDADEQYNDYLSYSKGSKYTGVTGDVLNYSSDFGKGFNNNLKNLGSLGMSDYFRQDKIQEIVDKEAIGEKLTEAEQDYKESYKNYHDLKASPLNDRFMYTQGIGFNGTVQFIGELVVVDALTAGAGTAFSAAKLAAKGEQALAKVVLKEGMKKAIPFMKAGSSTTAAAIEGGGSTLVKGISTAGKEIGKAAISPSSFTKADTKYAKTYFENEKEIKMNANDFKIVSSQINKLENKENKTEKDEIEIERLKLTKDKIKEKQDKIINLTDNYITGTAQNTVERFSEVFVGKAVDNIGDFLPAAGSYLSASKHSKIAKIGKVINNVDDKMFAFRQGINQSAKILKAKKVAKEVLKKVDNVLLNAPSKLGKLSKTTANFVGEAAHINSYFGEIVEEVATQLTPIYQEDYAQQLEELKNPEFYVGIAMTTGLLNASTNIMSRTINGTSSFFTSAEIKALNLKNKKDNEKIKNDVKNIYSELDNSIVDDQFAQDIAMASYGTVFQRQDVLGRIAELEDTSNTKEPGTQEERQRKADLLRKADFNNLMQHAINTGTEKDFKNKLRKISLNNDSTSQQKEAAINTLNKLKKITEARAKYKDAINFNEVIDLTMQQLNHEDRLKDFSIYTEEQKLKAAEEIKQYNKDNNITDLLLNLDNLENFQTESFTEEQNIAYSQWLNDIIKDSSLVRDYLIMERNKNTASLVTTVKDKLKYELDPANNEAIINREKEKAKKRIVENTTIENIDENKEELAELELDTPDVIAQLNQQAITTSMVSTDTTDEEDQVKMQELLEELDNTDENNTEEVERILNQIEILDKKIADKQGVEIVGFDNIDTSVLYPDTIQGTPDDISQPINLSVNSTTINDNNNQPNTTTSLEDQSLVDTPIDTHIPFSPVTYNPDDEVQKNLYQRSVDFFKQIVTQNPELQFKGIIGRLFNELPTNILEQNIKVYAEAWNNVSKNTVTAKEVDDLYKSYFGSQEVDTNLLLAKKVEPKTDDVPEVSPAVVVAESLEPVVVLPNMVLEIIDETDTTEKSFLNATKEFIGRKFHSVGLKAGFLGLKYVEKDNKKQTIDVKVNTSALPFIDPRNFKAGDKLKLVTNLDYIKNPENPISFWTNYDNNDVEKVTITMRALVEKIFNKPYAEIMDLMETNPEAVLLHPEFIKYVPIGIENNAEFTDDTNVLEGGLNDYYWFNISNVALLRSADGTPMYEERLRRIADNRRINLETKKQIIKNGGLTVKVKSKSEGEANRQLLITEKEKEQEYSDAFQSIQESFKDINGNPVSMEEAQKNSAIGVIDSKFHVIMSSKESETKHTIIKVNGREVLVKDILNYGDLESKLNGTLVMVVQVDFDKENPKYIIHEIISNHKAKKADFETIYKIKGLLIGYKNILNNESKFATTPQQLTEALNARKYFQDNFGFDLKSQVSLDSVLEYYPEKIKNKVKEGENPYRQDYRIKLTGSQRNINSNIPDLLGYSSVQEFKNAIAQNKVGKTNMNNIAYSNMHTQYIYTGVTNKGETVYTNAIQPVIIYTDNHIVKKENATNELESLETRVAFNEKLLALEEDEGKKEEIKETIIEVKEKIDTLKQKIEVIETQIEQGVIATEDKPVKTSRQFSLKDQYNIVSNLVYKGIAKIDLSKAFTKADLLTKIEEEYNLLEKQLLADNLLDELEFLRENKNEILGKKIVLDGVTIDTNYDASVREILDAILNTNETIDELDFSSENIKNQTKESFQNDVRTSLSMKVKILLAGIKDTRSGSSAENNFNGFPEMFNLTDSLDALQQIMSMVDNNTLEDVKKVVEKLQLKNSAEFAFLSEIVERLEKVQKESPDILNQILSSLFQPKVKMDMILFNKNNDGSFSMKKFDANSKDPKILTNAKWKSNFKQSKILDVTNNSFFKLSEQGALLYDELYKELIANKTKENLKNYFKILGINLTDKSYKSILDIEHPMYGVVFGSNMVIDNINKNIQTLKKGEFQYTFNSNDITDKATQRELKVLDGNNSKLNDLINFDNSLRFIPSNMMYIGKKLISVYEQPKLITNKVRELKNDPKFLEDLLSTQISADNFLINLLNKYPQYKEHIDIITTSLEPIKEKGKNKDVESITKLSPKDAFLTKFNLFAHSDGNVVIEEFVDKGIQLRKGSIAFPTISDTSVLPLFKTILLNIQASDITDNKMSDSLSDVFINQMVKGDLLRIGAFLRINGSTNIKGMDFGSLQMTNFPSLNVLPVDFEYTNKKGEVVKTKRLLKDIFINNPEYHTEKGLNDFLDLYKEQIKENINEVINDEVNAYISEDGQSGFFVDNDIYKEGQLNYIDEDYLKSKDNKAGTTLDKARLSAFDYVINSFMQSKEIHTVFTGDIAGFFKDKMGDNLVYGNGPVTTDDIINTFYKDKKSEIQQLINDEEYELLFNVFDKLKYSDEFISYDVSHEDQYVNAILPSLVTKNNEMFKSVQDILSKRLKGMVSPGTQEVNSHSNTTYYQIMIDDVETGSNVLDYLLKLNYPKLYDANIADVKEYTLLDRIYKGNRTQEQKDRRDDLHKKLKKNLPNIQAFLETTSTDAQEYASWRDNLKQLRDNGKINLEQYNIIHTKLNKQEDDLDNNGVISKENLLTQDEIRMAMMQPSKPLYTGVHFEEFVINDEESYNASRFIYIKSSSFPILPQLAGMFPEFNAKRKVINKLEKDLNGKGKENNVVVRLSYNTANKVGAAKKSLSISELYDPNLSSQRIDEAKVILKKENFYIQQDKPLSDTKGYVGIASQMEKILLGDGINKIEEKVFDNLFDEDFLNEAGVKKDDRNKVSGTDLKKLYDLFYKKQQAQYKQDLFNELGISNYTDLDNRDVNAMEKLSVMLNKRLSNKQDRKALELSYKVKGNPYQVFTKQEVIDNDYEIESADFKIPLFITPNSQKFESVFNAIIAKSSINLKTNGFSSPVASQQGFSLSDYNDDLFKHLKESGLILTSDFNPEVGLTATINSETGLKEAQVFITNKYKYLNKETNKVEYLDLTKLVNENNILDETKLPRELLNMFSFRIPTSSHQSGVIIKVVGFLPESHADLMIVPKDHTVQIGEDYDIDTRYVYNYHFTQDENGNYKKLELSDIPKREDLEIIEQKLYEEYNTYKQELKDDYFLNNNNNFSNKKYFESNLDLMIEIAEKKTLIAAHKSISVSRELYEKSLNVTLDDTSIEELEQELKDLLAQSISNIDYNKQSNEFKQAYENYSNYLLEAFRNDKKNVRTAFYKTLSNKNIRGLESKILQNNIISLYKSVFLSESNNIQKMINQTLSTDNTKDTVTMMDDLLSKSKTKHFNIHSPMNQSRVMELGANGKIGTGVHSNGVTQNSLFQQHAKLDENGNSNIKHVAYYNEGVPVFYNIQLGNMTFDGQLGRIFDLSGKTRISATIMESQNTSLDNQNLGYMGLRNETSETINIFLMMQLTGLDVIKNINDKNVSYASLFINQPILRDYVKLNAKNNSVTTTTKIDVIKELRKKYSEGVEQTYFDTEEITDKKDKIVEKVIIGKLKPKFINEVGKELTHETLIDQLTIPNNLSQLMILDTFEKLSIMSAQYSELQQFINIENGGLGKSYFDVIENMNTLLSIASGSIKITNSKKMIGDYKTIFRSSLESDDVKKLISEGYVFVKQDEDFIHLIKPTHHYSHKIVNSIANGYNLWKSFFPYENTVISDQVDEIINSKKLSKKEKEALKYKVIYELKDYIISDNKTLFQEDVMTYSKELFFDNVKLNKQSLASYLQDLSNNEEYASLFKQPFFRDLKYHINDSLLPSYLEFNSNDNTSVSDIDIYNLLKSMINSDKQLPKKNGNDYTEADLMKELLMYSLLANQENGAIGFRNKLPIELFEKYDVLTNIKNKTIAKDRLNQSLVYNGLNRSVETLLGSSFNDKGFASNVNSINHNQVDSLLFKINAIQNRKNGTNGIKYVERTDDNTSVYLNHYNNDIVHSAYKRQFIQHNPLTAFTIPYYINKSQDSDSVKYDKNPFTVLMKENGHNASSIDNKKVTHFYTNLTHPYINITDSSGNNNLYELKRLFAEDKNYYEQINTLGSFGFNEYQVGVEVNKSLVAKNNPKKVFNTPIILSQNQTIDTLFNLDSAEEVLAEFKKAVAEGVDKPLMKTSVKSLLLNTVNSTAIYKNNKNIPLLKLLLPLVNIDTLKMVVGESKGYAQYNVATNTIVLDRTKISDNMSKEQIQDIIIEEFLHAVTINTIDKYVNISSIDNQGKIQYTVKEGMTVPADLRTLLIVYQKGIDAIVKDKGLSFVTDTLNKENQLRANNEQMSFTANEIDVYKTSTIHEFIAGVFIKNTTFSELMANTTYMSSGKSILAKFAEKLGNLFHRLLPNRRTDTISAATLESLYNFLLNHNKEYITENNPTFTNVFLNEQTMSVIEEAEALVENVPDKTIPNVDNNVSENVNIDKINNKEENWTDNDNNCGI